MRSGTNATGHRLLREMLRSNTEKVVVHCWCHSEDHGKMGERYSGKKHDPGSEV
jgi:hypothetical protein